MSVFMGGDVILIYLTSLTQNIDEDTDIFRE